MISKFMTITLVRDIKEFGITVNACTLTLTHARTHTAKDSGILKKPPIAQFRVRMLTDIL